MVLAQTSQAIKALGISKLDATTYKMFVWLSLLQLEPTVGGNALIQCGVILGELENDIREQLMNRLSGQDKPADGDGATDATQRELLLSAAEYQAAKLGQDYLCTTHLLLAVLPIAQDALNDACSRHGIRRAVLENAIQQVERKPTT